MDWKKLTIGQICGMLLDENYRNLWEPLKFQLRAANGKGDPPAYPMFPVTFALTAAAVWHAMSVRRVDPETIGMEYLEREYSMWDLFWDPARPNGQYAYAQYLAYRAPRAEASEARRLDICLTRIRERCACEDFRADMPLEELLDRIDQESSTSWRNYTNRLRELLETWARPLPEEAFPPAEPEPEPAELDQPFLREICDLLENGVRQIIFTGAPGTGKTYAAKRLAAHLGALHPSCGDPGALQSYTLTQFHPSYDYTDFVEGLRPVRENGQICFVKMDGVLKAFCRWVAAHGDPARKYFFLIDEINRAELSKVFGELMYCLEPDKRGPENRVQTQYQNLNTYDRALGRELTWDPASQTSEDIFAQGFFIPENVCIIGTMNDIDRSVEGMDFALRRRFNIREFLVDIRDGGPLTDAFSAMGFAGGTAKTLADRTIRLNRTLASKGAVYGLNRQYFIAQGYFANLPASIPPAGPPEDILRYVWTYRLETLLREYLRGVDEARIDAFLEECRSAFFSEDADV